MPQDPNDPHKADEETADTRAHGSRTIAELRKAELEVERERLASQERLRLAELGASKDAKSDEKDNTAIRNLTYGMIASLAVNALLVIVLVSLLLGRDLATEVSKDGVKVKTGEAVGRQVESQETSTQEP